jgi:hypothetical protein
LLDEISKGEDSLVDISTDEGEKIKIWVE